MPNKARVLFVGLHPDVVDYGRWPGLTPEKLLASLKVDEHRLGEIGYGVSICFVDRGETAEHVLRDTLEKERVDCVMIGAGVRLDAEQFLLFEKVINVVHRHAPDAAICFNTGPTDSAAAVQRWV